MSKSMWVLSMPDRARSNWLEALKEVLSDEVILEQLPVGRREELHGLESALRDRAVERKQPHVELVELSVDDVHDLNELLLDTISRQPTAIVPLTMARLHELRDRLPIPGGHRALVPPESKAAVTRSELLEEADRIIGGDRAETYGDAAASFLRIGELWAARLRAKLLPGATITGPEVAQLMVLMKVSRLHEHDDHADSWLDIAGYAALGAEIAGAKL